MKKTVKMSLALVMFVALVITFGSKVIAAPIGSSYTYAIQLYDGGNYTTSQEDYDGQDYGISVKANDFLGYDCCKCAIDLYKKDLIGKTFLAGGIPVLDTIGKTYTFTRGTHPPCKAFYYFESKSGGLQAYPVICYSE